MITVIVLMGLVGVYGLFRLCVGSPDEAAASTRADPTRDCVRLSSDPYEDSREREERDLFPRNGGGNSHGPLSNNGVFDD